MITEDSVIMDSSHNKLHITKKEGTKTQHLSITSITFKLVKLTRNLDVCGLHAVAMTVHYVHEACNRCPHAHM